MNRRFFLTTSAGALVAWLSPLGAAAAEAGAAKRVGLIGCGWYGKCDLLRLLQVTPVEVAALCDPDRTMLTEAGALVASRQVSRKTPRLHADFREMLKDKDLEKHVAPAIRGHMRDWLQAVASRGKPVADIEQGHISSASCILANHSADLHRTLAWDPASHQVTADAEATKLLARPYRAPWVHPGKS